MLPSRLPANTDMPKPPRALRVIRSPSFWHSCNVRAGNRRAVRQARAQARTDSCSHCRADPAPAVTPSPKQEPKFTFILGLDKFGDFSRVSLNTYSGVLRSCANRLDDSILVKSEVDSSNMSYGNAVRRAKAEKQAYVVWIQLRQLRSEAFRDKWGPPTTSILNTAYLSQLPPSRLRQEAPSRRPTDRQDPGFRIHRPVVITT